MNESTVIIIFVAANPSKDISSARKKNSPNKGRAGECRSQVSEHRSKLNPDTGRHLGLCKVCLTEQTKIFYLRIKLSNSLGDANKSIATKKI